MQFPKIIRAEQILLRKKKHAGEATGKKSSIISPVYSLGPVFDFEKVFAQAILVPTKKLMNKLNGKKNIRTPLEFPPPSPFKMKYFDGPSLTTCNEASFHYRHARSQKVSIVLKKSNHAFAVLYLHWFYFMASDR